jgi:hypothetical protein
MNPKKSRGRVVTESFAGEVVLTIELKQNYELDRQTEIRIRPEEMSELDSVR